MVEVSTEAYHFYYFSQVRRIELLSWSCHCENLRAYNNKQCGRGFRPTRYTPARL